MGNDSNYSEHFLKYGTLLMGIPYKVQDGKTERVLYILSFNPPDIATEYRMMKPLHDWEIDQINNERIRLKPKGRPLHRYAYNFDHSYTRVNSKSEMELRESEQWSEKHIEMDIDKIINKINSGMKIPNNIIYQAKAEARKFDRNGYKVEIAEYNDEGPIDLAAEKYLKDLEAIK
jgi:hypothetical protein